MSAPHSAWGRGARGPPFVVKRTYTLPEEMTIATMKERDIPMTETDTIQIPLEDRLMSQDNQPLQLKNHTKYDAPIDHRDDEHYDADRLWSTTSCAARGGLRNLTYTWETKIVFLDAVPVNRDVLRAAMAVFGRDLAEHPIWHDEIVAVYDGFDDLRMPTGALAHLLRAWGNHRRAVEHATDRAEVDDALEAAEDIPVPLDHLEEVFYALAEKLARRNDGMEPLVGAYADAEEEVRALAGITAALRAYERNVLIPRRQEEEQGKKEA